MINFNTVIDNFDRVYKARTQKEESIFLNSSLEVVKRPSEKASFFDIIVALQFRKWDSSSIDSSSPQLSRSIKKILLQAKLIYDNDPFPVKIPCKYIELLDKSILEGVFSDPLDFVKTEVYAEEVRKYCEILYFYKLLIEADEKLSKVSTSDNLNFPPNLENFNKSAEELFHKILCLIQTKEFKFLTEAKYKDPLLYLSVFIEGTEEKIEKTYPEILHILQLAELAYSKKQLHHTKGKFTAQELRDKFLSILNDPVSGKIKQQNAREKIFFMAGYNRSTLPSFNEIYKYKEEMKLYLNNLDSYISHYENELRVNKRNISISTEYKIDFSKDVYQLKLCLESMKSYLHEDCFATLCFQYFPFLETQHTYINSFRHLITTLKIEKLGFCNTSSGQKKARPLKKSKEAHKESIMQNLNRITLESSDFEKKVIQEHFPTLTQAEGEIVDQKRFSLLKLELINAAKIYTLLKFELTKTHSFNPSLEKKNSAISPAYEDLIRVLSGSESPSLPSTEEFSKIQEPTSFPSFFSAFFCFKELKHLDQIIVTFYKETEKNLQTKLKEYSQEFLRLQKQKKTPIKRPKAISKDSFTASTSKKNESAKHLSSTYEEIEKLHVEPSTEVTQKNAASEKKDIVDQQEIKPSTSSTFVEESPTPEDYILNEDETNFIELDTTERKKTSCKTQQSFPSSNREPKPLEGVTPITSLKILPSVTVEEKIKTILYHDHVSRWFSNTQETLNDPRYAGFNITKSQRKERIVYHAFPRLIDSLLNTNYSLKEVDPSDPSITRYGIPGIIFLDTKKHHGIFEYTMNANNLCFHRCFSRKTDNFKKIKPINVSKDTSKKIENKYCSFVFGKTPVEFNAKKREITITDFKLGAQFTIVHPDNYWELPNKIINLS